MNILVDNSVRHHAVALKGEWVDTGTVLWCGRIPIQTGYLRSHERGQPVRKSHGGDQTRYIASIASKVDELKLRFHTTDALTIEKMHLPAGKQSGTNYGDVSHFANMTFENHTTLPELEFAIPNQQPIVELRKEIEKQSDPVFSEIWSELKKIKLTDKSSQDAWHLYCAIKLRMDFFLTADSTLFGQVRSIPARIVRQRLAKLVARPFELCRHLEIEPLSDQQFEQFKCSLPRIF